MDITDIQAAPYPVLRAEAQGILDELTTGPDIVAALDEAHFPVEELIAGSRRRWAGSRRRWPGSRRR